MSTIMNSSSQKPAPEFMSPTPYFKEDGLLPKTPGDVLRNYREQQAAFRCKAAPRQSPCVWVHPSRGIAIPRRRLIGFL